MKAPWRDPRSFAVSHGLIHAVVDAACVATLFGTRFAHHLTHWQAFYLIFGYDMLAFAGQGAIGPLLDRWRLLRPSILASLGLVAGGVLFLHVNPVAAAVLVALGNALYHVAAGALSLHVDPGRAAPPGIFVAPGALGLAIGTFTGKHTAVIEWPFLLALGLSLLLAWRSAHPPVRLAEPPGKGGTRYAAALLLLLLFSIAVRSLVGRGGAYACPKLTFVAFSLGAAAFAGKALGGILADRFGWLRVGVGALLLSAPLIVFGGADYPVVVIGMLLFQMTMPVTLVAVSVLLPGRPALAFGFCSTALIVGAIPTFFKSCKAYYGPWPFLVLILLSAAALWVGLRGLRGVVPMKYDR
ncbi:MAG: MFS transporter [Myxococcales bacterium]|nr:MFS transporter [Myxococcales bacterium]